MHVKKLFSLSAALICSSIGLFISLLIGWIPALLLSLIGLGPIIYVACGLAGIAGGFLCYTALFKRLGFWPFDDPPVSRTTQALQYTAQLVSLIPPKPEDTLYLNAKKALFALENELRSTYQQGIRNFKLEFDSPQQMTNQFSNLTKTLSTTSSNQSEDQSFISRWFFKKNS